MWRIGFYGCRWTSFHFFFLLYFFFFERHGILQNIKMNEATALLGVKSCHLTVCGLVSMRHGHLLCYLQDTTDTAT